MRQRGTQATRASLLAALVMLVLAGCATAPRPEPSYITLLSNPDGSVGKVTVRGAGGERLIERERDAAPLDGSLAPAPVEEVRFQRDFAEAMAAQPQNFVLYFESGSTQLKAESQSLLPEIRHSVDKRASADMSIIGHSDTLGSAELNESLSLKRAQAVADWLRSQHLRVDTLSEEAQGKRQLLVPTPDARAEARNRRVEVTVR